MKDPFFLENLKRGYLVLPGCVWDHFRLPTMLPKDVNHVAVWVNSILPK